MKLFIFVLVGFSSTLFVESVRAQSEKEYRLHSETLQERSNEDSGKDVCPKLLKEISDVPRCSQDQGELGEPHQVQVSSQCEKIQTDENPGDRPLHTFQVRATWRCELSGL